MHKRPETRAEPSIQDLAGAAVRSVQGLQPARVHGRGATGGVRHGEQQPHIGVAAQQQRQHGRAIAGARSHAPAQSHGQSARRCVRLATSSAQQSLGPTTDLVRC